MTSLLLHPLPGWNSTLNAISFELPVAFSDVIVGALTSPTAHTVVVAAGEVCAPGSFMSLTATTLMETCCSEYPMSRDAEVDGASTVTGLAPVALTVYCSMLRPFVLDGLFHVTSAVPFEKVALTPDGAPGAP